MGASSSGGWAGWGAPWRTAGESLGVRVERTPATARDSVGRELVSGVATAIAHEPVFLRTGPDVHVVLFDRGSGEHVHAWEFGPDEGAAQYFLSMVERDLERMSVADFEAEYSLSSDRADGGAEA
jgi:hypothetical protein